MSQIKYKNDFDALYHCSSWGYDCIKKCTQLNTFKRGTINLTHLKRTNSHYVYLSQLSFWCKRKNKRVRLQKYEEK